jgi:hypothetical protein
VAAQWISGEELERSGGASEGEKERGKAEEVQGLLLVRRCVEIGRESTELKRERITRLGELPGEIFGRRLMTMTWPDSWAPPISERKRKKGCTSSGSCWAVGLI